LPFEDIARERRQNTLKELKSSDIAVEKRLVVYSWGAAEALLLDRLHPQWKEQYFSHRLQMSPFFDASD